MGTYLKKSEIAKLLGIPKSTVRYYEQMGLIQPKIDDNQYRQYSIVELKQLSQILFLRSLDFDIEAIRAMLNDPETSPLEALRGKRDDVLHQLNALKRQLRHIDAISALNTLEQAHLRTTVQAYPARYFYRLDPASADLSDLLSDNRALFNTHHMGLGGWFVKMCDTDALKQSAFPAFSEYVEITDDKRFKASCHIMPAGDYLCLDLVLEGTMTLDWEEIRATLTQNMTDKNFRLRTDVVLVVNQDTFNFNFDQDTRLLSVQVAIKA